MPITRFQELPLFKYLLPSLAATCEPSQFDYAISVGVDAGDPWYSAPANTTAMIQWWVRHWQRMHPVYSPPTLVFHVYANTASRPVWAVNYVAQHAYEDGADYLFQVNDDTELHANNWSSVMVKTLQSFLPFPGCGVVAPYDSFPKRELMTYSFVARCHIEIFGTYFPPAFHNYFSDDWITFVYKSLPASFGKDAEMSVILAHITVRHVVLPERYERMATTVQYQRQLVIGQTTLREYGEKRLKKERRLS